MHRIEGTYYTTDSSGNKIFQDTEENRTLSTAAWLNTIQEEIANIIEGLGGTLTSESGDTSRNQIYSTMTDIGITAPYVEEVVADVSGTTLVTDPGYGFKKIIRVDCSINPSGVDPSGTFRDGYIVEVELYGAFGIGAFDSTGLNVVMSSTHFYEFVYCLSDDSWYHIT